MVCTANDLLGWKDFPKGLRVLLLDEDSSSAAEIRSKLEEMDYIVSTFYDENEAMLAISSKTESFHVAIVEVSIGNSAGKFKFLETAKDLPTIMTSNMHCLSTMMKCIALGAVEFLRKPLSEDKLRNIWQHVLHKAFNAGEKDAFESLKPIKESVVAMLQLQLEKEEPKNEYFVKTEDMTPTQDNEELSTGSDKYPAPSTPQLKQGVRLLDDGDCNDQTIEKESGDEGVECKSVETTCDTDNSVAEATVQMSLGETVIKGENELVDGFKGDSNICPCPQDEDSHSNLGCGAGVTNKASGLNNSCGTKSNRKKIKVEWTPELHKKFVKAVEQLGVDQAVPSRILELMKVEGLTRHNIASHLQKYRMQRRHILPKEDERRWSHPRNLTQESYYPHKSVMAFPPYHSNYALPAGQVYPPWGPPSNYPAGVQMWGPPHYPPWQPTESWHWKPYAGMHADAWGCPVMPAPFRYCPPLPQNMSAFHGAENMHNSGITLPHNSFDVHPAEEVIDRVVKEAISKPWLPLPLGLKPPSTESVLTELYKQGISIIPPPHSHPR